MLDIMPFIFPNYFITAKLLPSLPCKQCVDWIVLLMFQPSYWLGTSNIDTFHVSYTIHLCIAFWLTLLHQPYLPFTLHYLAVPIVLTITTFLFNGCWVHYLLVWTCH